MIETKRHAYVEIRSQHAKRRGLNAGPDTYVAVQVVPPGAEALTTLNSAVAARRGIEIIHCGEGYSRRQKTAKSMLGRAIVKAGELAARINVEAELVG